MTHNIFSFYLTAVISYLFLLFNASLSEIKKKISID